MSRINASTPMIENALMRVVNVQGWSEHPPVCSVPFCVNTLEAGKPWKQCRQCRERSNAPASTPHKQKVVSTLQTSPLVSFSLYTQCILRVRYNSRTYHVRAVFSFPFLSLPLWPRPAGGFFVEVAMSGGKLLSARMSRLP